MASTCSPDPGVPFPTLGGKVRWLQQMMSEEAIAICYCVRRATSDLDDLRVTTYILRVTTMGYFFFYFSCFVDGGLPGLPYVYRFASTTWELPLSLRRLHFFVLGHRLVRLFLPFFDRVRMQGGRGAFREAKRYRKVCWVQGVQTEMYLFVEKW